MDKKKWTDETVWDIAKAHFQKHKSEIGYISYSDIYNNFANSFKFILQSDRLKGWSNPVLAIEQDPEYDAYKRAEDLCWSIINSKELVLIHCPIRGSIYELRTKSFISWDKTEVEFNH